MGTVQKISGKSFISWRARVDVGRDIHGKRVRETETFRLKKDAEAWVAMMETRAQRNPSAASWSKLTLDAYVKEHWLPFYLTQAAPSSYIKRKGVMESHVLPRLGRMRLQDITSRHIQQLYSELAPTLSPTTIDGVGAALKVAFNTAIRWEMLERNPCDGARPPRMVKRNPQIWTPENFRHFLDSESDPIFRALWVTITVTGARLGEILPLTWNDLDRESGTIAITKTLTRDHSGRWIIGPTKTAKSNRVVPVPALVWPLFDEVRTASHFVVTLTHVPRNVRERTVGGQEVPGALVFVNVHGRPISESMAYNAWKNAIARAGVPAINIHDLRHLHTTTGLRVGIAMKVMSDRLGHANIGITADTYTHVERDIQHDAADRIAEYLFGHEDSSNE